VAKELATLRAAAKAALGELGEGVEIESSSLLRRQIARRCIYGVDINEIAVELARVGVWIHTFVPGLPLSLLDHNLVCGNSLTGIATVEEAVTLLDPDLAEGESSLWSGRISEWLDSASLSIAKLGRIADSTPAEVTVAYAALREARRAIEPARVLFDLLVAHQLNPRVDRPGHAVSDGFVLPDLTHDFTDHHDAKRVDAAVAPLKPLHFPLLFPEVFCGERPGFACIIGNPPWDKVRFEAQQYWVVRQPGLNALPTSQRDAAIERYRGRYPSLAADEIAEQADREREQKYFLAAYSIQGRGHLEYAKLFCERALRLLGSRGRLGYVLPRQCLVLAGWSNIRRAILRDSDIEIIQARNASGWLFDDVHHSIMVVLLARSPAEPTRPAAVVWPAVTTLREFHQPTREPVMLSAREIKSLSDALVIPWLDGPSDERLFEHMKVRPRLSSGAGWITGTHDARWDFRRSGPHGSLASRDRRDGFWDVLMTRHVGAYRLILSAPRQQYVAPSDLVPIARGVAMRDGQAVLDTNHPIIALRHPSRNDDSRTLIACALPEAGYVHCKGYVHAIAHPVGTDERDVLALLGFVNSFVCDWWARRFVDRHVTAPVVNNLPVPSWSLDQRRAVAELVEEMLCRHGTTTLAGGTKLSSVQSLAGEPQATIIARLEYVAAAGFDLGRSEMEGVLADFSPGACPESLRSEILEQWP
jgi:hypothetical protein